MPDIVQDPLRSENTQETGATRSKFYSNSTWTSYLPHMAAVLDIVVEPEPVVPVRNLRFHLLQ